jgi:hypothetical protein
LPPQTWVRLSVLTEQPIIGRTVAIALKYIGGDIVKVEEITIGPITTPDHPDPTESPRYIRDDRRAPPKALNKLGMVPLQNVGRKPQRANNIELTDFGEEGLQSDTSRIGLQP